MLIPGSSPGLALPVVTNLADCADFARTVQPYIPQLYNLPGDIVASYNDLDALRQLYLSTNPIISGFAFSLALFPIFLVVSEFNRNWSQVDRLWSILPALYQAHYAIWARLNGLPTARVDTVLAVSVVWSLRLTYNYWRKGGYQIGSEDYRWNLIKDYIGPFPFFLLNIVFTSSIQSVLLFAITTPTYIILLASQLQTKETLPTIGVDTLFSRGVIFLVIFEYFADQQQWDYQSAKKTYRDTAKVPPGWTRAQMDRGFNTTGAWQYSRHPNFAAEQAVWVVFYQWGCFSSGTLWNWTVAGAISYLLVFAGSTPITEWISKKKYPEYQLYQERVGRFVPKLWGKRWDEAQASATAVSGKTENKKSK